MLTRNTTTGKDLLKASWTALRKDPVLLTLPVLSAFFGIVAALAIFAPIAVVFGAEDAIPSSAETGDGNGIGIAWWVGAAVVAYVTTSITVFFQVALAAGAMRRLDGGTPTLGYCLGQAAQRVPQILMWSLITATVGLVLRALSERGGILGAAVRLFGGVAWAVLTFFVVPVILAEKQGGWSALGRSKSLMQDTWGPVARSGLRFGFLFLVPALLFFGALLGGLALTFITFNPVWLGLAALGLAGLLSVAILGNATATYLRTVLYRYAVGLPVPGIGADVLARAVAVRSS